jgi:hypothetical protein
MVIYLHNQHIGPIEQLLRAALDTAETVDTSDAILAALAAIEQQKEHAPYRLWLRANPPTTQENAP